MSGTAFKCGKCDGKGVLLIEINPDGDKEIGNSYIEMPCDFCRGERLLTKSQLMTKPVDATLQPDQFLPIPVTGAMRVYLDGSLYDRKMSSRQMFVLAKQLLDVAIETQNFERERDADGTDNSGNAG